MQFLPATGAIDVADPSLSIPFLNKLNFPRMGEQNAQMGAFRLLTQANWQGAPSRGRVQTLCRSRHLVHSPLLRLLTGRLPTLCGMPPNGGSI